MGLSKSFPKLLDDIEPKDRPDYDSRVALPWNPQHGALRRIGVCCSQPYENKGARRETVDVTRESPQLTTQEFCSTVPTEQRDETIARLTAATIQDIEKLIRQLTEHRDRLMSVEIVRVGSA